MVRKSLIFTAIVLLVPLVAIAQTNPTGTLSGAVESEDGDSLPGVTVTATASTLQGARVGVSSGDGSFRLGLLPPGRYRVAFELEGFQSQTLDVQVAAAQSRELSVTLGLREVSETIIVTSAVGQISETSGSAVTYGKDLVERLANNRSIEDYVKLAPGVAATGPSDGRAGNLVINGAQSWENLYLLNGVPINENLRGQASNIYIEDAIQEVTTSTTGVSAEYGRFSGGVVNTITKAGGNNFHFSARDNLTNQDWESVTPFGETKSDKLNETYEATLGGYVLKDRLWFFGAGRDFDRQESKSTERYAIPYDETRAETRLEGKLTLNLASSHTLLASLSDVDDVLANDDQGGVQDPRALSKNSSFPEEALAFNYNGVLTNNFFVEAQYSERKLAFVGIGGTNPDRILGSPILPFDAGDPRDSVIYNPQFDANEDTTRDSDHAILKGSYFLSTESAGSHDFVFGVDEFHDEIGGNNKQSSTDYDIWSATTEMAASGEIVPIFAPGNSIIIYRPILESSLGSDLKSNGLFVNDRWSKDKWSFNLGVRYDENDGVDSAGNVVSQDSKVSPRLGVSYDLKGDGSLVVHGNAGVYVSRIAQGNVGNAGSAAGSPAFFAWGYGGPPINTDLSLTTEQSMQQLFAWFDSIGGLNAVPNFGQNIPGATTIIDGNLRSPEVTEFSLGITKRIGSRGSVRAELVRRDYGDMFITRRDLTTGSGVDPNGNPFDQGFIVNDDSTLERTYDGLLVNGTYRLNDRINIGGSLTLADSRGNFNGEGRGTGPITGDVFEYPEFKAFEQHSPVRDLAIDQEYTVRTWALFDIFDTKRHSLSVSWQENLLSGQRYSAIGDVNTLGLPEFAGLPYIGDNLSVADIDYFFATDAYKTDEVHRTDISLQYFFKFNAFGTQHEIGILPQVINVFNEDAIINVNANDVNDATIDPSLQTFNPFTDTPVEGVHWSLGDQFGLAESDEDYQAPRTYRLSVVYRF